MKHPSASLPHLMLLGLFLVSLFLGNFNKHEASLLPLLDTPPTLLSHVWQESFPDPFRVLEQIPLGLEKDDNMPLSPLRVDWKETPNGHVITLDVPGLTKDDVNIQVDENRLLRVSGERKRQEDSEGDHWHRVERSYGKFWRQFRLPENADLDSIKAKLQHGVLNIHFTKLSPDKVKAPRVVSIAAEKDQTDKPQSSEPREEL